MNESAQILRGLSGGAPYGTPAEVAEFVRPYVQAGCSAFKVIPCAETAIAAVGERRRLLAPAH